MQSPLLELKKLRQSVWYDDLNREALDGGLLERIVSEYGVSGGTSNPTIFERAFDGSDAYEGHFQELAERFSEPQDIYDGLTVTDVQRSADMFRDAYDASRGRDGYACLEVSPKLAYDTEATVREAHRLFEALDRPNVMIKIPGTQPGLPAIERCLAEGINVNITLLFAVDNYDQVANAYMSALEQRLEAGKPLDAVASVASFFVSRVDALTDKRLDERIEAAADAGEKERLASLKGQAAIANARLAYARFLELTSEQRWRRLAEAGARPQRCLWASTSTKNPDYRDVMYIEGLIGSDTVNTMPLSTMEGFHDHGRVTPDTVTSGLDEARRLIEQLEAAGISFKGVTDELQEDGVDKFIASYENAIQAITNRARGVPARS